jgi:hypothetical protein
LSGSILSFTGVSFSDGDYFSIGVNVEYNGPADVYEDIKFWLRADKDVTGSSPVTAWDDQSNSYDASAPGNSPDLVSSAINYNPALDFTSSNHEYLQITNGIFGNSLTSDVWVYMVNKADINQTQTTLYETMDGSNERFAVLAPYNANVYYDLGVYPDGRVSGAWGGTFGNYYMWTFGTSTSTSTPSGTRKVIYRDGESIYTNNNNKSVTGNNSNLIIGGGWSDGLGTTRNFDGQIAEVVIYTGVPTPLEQEKVQTYLALKYGITKNSADNGSTGAQDERDYFASDGTVIWDYSDGSSYNHDIIGLMRDDKSDFTQKQSITPDDSIAIYISSLAASNSANTGSISNNISSVIIGHNDSILHGDKNLSKPTGVYSRFGRVWKVTNTNFSDNFSLEIEWAERGSFDISDIRLLVDNDDDFSNATILSSADGLTFSVGSIIVSGISTSHIPMNSTRYITIASVDSANTPLPIELISFSAKQSGDKVNINWKTATETNNDYFTIERSADGYQFDAIASIEGAGNSSTANNYEIIDHYPINGINYYRLRQTDYDGKFSYSQVVFVNMNKASDIRISPNPTDGIIRIEGENINFEDISIFNSLGQNVKFKVSLSEDSDDYMILNLDKLPKGIYFIRTQSNVLKVYKE